jgi:hypothetical protein
VLQFIRSPAVRAIQLLEQQKLGGFLGDLKAATSEEESAGEFQKWRLRGVSKVDAERKARKIEAGGDEGRDRGQKRRGGGRGGGRDGGGRRDGGGGRGRGGRGNNKRGRY